MVEIYLLEQFIEVYRSGTLTKAAENLNITQSALSRSMKKLEDSLQIPLFERSKNKITLTTFGEQTAQFAISYIQRGDDWIAQLQRNAKNHYSFTFGACSPQTVVDVTQLTDEKYPEADIIWEMKDNEELLQGVSDGKFLFAFLHTPQNNPFTMEDNELYSCFYGSEQLYINIPNENPLSQKKELSFQDIDGITMILYQNTGFWEKICQLKTPNIRFLMVSEMQALTDVLPTSPYPSFTTDIILSNYGEMSGFTPIPISDSEASTDYYFICKKENLDAIRELKLFDL